MNGVWSRRNGLLMLGLGFVVGISVSTVYAGVNIADNVKCLTPCVSGFEIVEQSVGGLKIKDNSIYSVDIKDGRVKSIDIKDGTITSADLGVLTDLTISGNIVSSNDICIGTCP